MSPPAILASRVLSPQRGTVYRAMRSASHSKNELNSASDTKTGQFPWPAQLIYATSALFPFPPLFTTPPPLLFLLPAHALLQGLLFPTAAFRPKYEACDCPRSPISSTPPPLRIDATVTNLHWARSPSQNHCTTQDS